MFKSMLGILLITIACAYGNAQDTTAIMKNNAAVTSQKLRSEKSEDVFIMKDLMKNIPDEIRESNLDSMVFKGGRLVFLNMDLLHEKTDDPNIKKVVESLINAIAITKVTPTVGDEVHVSELLKDLPREVQMEFLDNLMLKNGAIVSAYIAGLQRTLPSTDVHKILTTFSDSTATYEKKTLCGNGVCYDEICTSHKTSRWACESRKGSSCYSPCD